MSDRHGGTMNRELAERREDFRRRAETYLRLGHDIFAAARFVGGCGDPPAGPVLDVGTGKGIFALELARRGFQVVSIESKIQYAPLGRRSETGSLVDLGDQVGRSGGTAGRPHAEPGPGAARSADSGPLLAARPRIG